MSPDTSAPILSVFDFDDPGVTQDERLAAIRALLTRRVERARHPSRAINQLHAAHVRCHQASKELADLASRAPRILAVIRHALREAFALDPDTLLFSEPPPPQPAHHVNSLTDRTLALFSDPGVPVNLHHFTALSLRDEPGRALAFNATQALARVSQLGLAVRISQAMTGYWQQLARGSWLSRRERWVQLRKAMFADQAYLAHQLFQLSNAGYAMARQLMDAPSAEARQRAGGAWATLQVGAVAWPHVGVGVLAIPGALHLCRVGAVDGPQVIYLPGLQCAFHEFCSWHQVQTDLPALVQTSLLSGLWQYLPFKHGVIPPLTPGAVLSQDALAQSAHALLDGQWSNEWGSVLSLNYAAPLVSPVPLPSRRVAQLLRFIEKGRKRLCNGLPLASSLDALLAWDQQRRQPQILLASLSSELPRNHCTRQVRRYESALQALLNAHEPARESEDYRVFSALEGERQAQGQIVSRWTQDDSVRLLQTAFWQERPDGTRKRATLVLNALRRALRQEAQLEHRLKLIKQTHLDRLLEVLNTPLAAQRVSSDTRVLQVAVGGDSQARYRLMGVFVVTTARALLEPSQPQPVVLVVGGSFGGLAVFEHLDNLSHGLGASLGGRDECLFWRCIGRDVRAVARAEMAQSVQVDYRVVGHDVMYEDLKALIEHHARLSTLLDAPVRLFSEVSDPSVGRLLLAEELREHLHVPVNEVRTAALANLDFLRFAAGHANTQPTWLATATQGQRQRHKRLQRRYLSSAMALENRLWHVLPPLYAFARRLLIAQLTRDGFYPGLDIDMPLLHMPDDVGSQFCGWSSQCPPGDRHVKMRASPERTTFSLLELALHNLDPIAPWTEWRLNRAHYLAAAWKERLSPRYLIKTLSALDIGGQYNALIVRVFQPASRELSRPLIDRATQQLAQVQAYSAARQGLSSHGQSLFNTAMAARSQAEMSVNGHQLGLGFVRLRGHTMAHDRHLAGMLAIIDRTSRRCLVYWPSAMGHPVLAEYASLALAKAALNRASVSADCIKALAQRVAPGWEEDALASYPGAGGPAKRAAVRLSRIVPEQVVGYAVFKVYEAISRFVRGFKIRHTLPAAELPTIEAQIKEQIDAEPNAWLDIVPTVHSDAQALLAHGRMLEVQQRAHARANSGTALVQYREQRLGEQWDATVRGLLSFVPVIGVGISLYEMLLAARRYHLGGRPEDAVDVAFLTLIAFVDVLTSLIPVGRNVRVGAVGRGLNQLHRRGARLSRLPSAPRPATLLERFRKPFATDDAIPLQGPGEKGVYVKNGEQFLVDGDHRYPVYRRGDEPALRIKSPGSEAEGELVLHIREDREWSLGADAPAPVAGPSSGALNPWRELVAHPPDWWPPIVRTATENKILQSGGVGSQWPDWRMKIQITPQLSSPAPGVFHVPLNGHGFDFHVLRIAPPYTSLSGPMSSYYRLVPQGPQAPLNRIVFITKNEPLVSLASMEIERWTRSALADQPLPASRTAAGEWQLHAPLFDRPLTLYVGQAFPTMTHKTREFVVARIVELAGPQRPATATHLLNIRATLDDWLPPFPARPGQTDDLLKLLRPTVRGENTTFISYQGASPGMYRVDFIPPFPLAQELHRGGKALAVQRDIAQRAAVKKVLEDQGFTVREFRVIRRAVPSQEGVATHPGSPGQLYYLSYAWFEMGHLHLGRRLTDNWLATAKVRNMPPAFSAEINTAFQGQRLVRILAGIQWPGAGDVSPSVYFLKMTP